MREKRDTHLPACAAKDIQQEMIGLAQAITQQRSSNSHVLCTAHSFLTGYFAVVRERTKSTPATCERKATTMGAYLFLPRSSLHTPEEKKEKERVESIMPSAYTSFPGPQESSGPVLSSVSLQHRNRCQPRLLLTMLRAKL